MKPTDMYIISILGFQPYQSLPDGAMYCLPEDLLGCIKVVPNKILEPMWFIKNKEIHRFEELQERLNGIEGLHKDLVLEKSKFFGTFSSKIITLEEQKRIIEENLKNAK